MAVITTDILVEGIRRDEVFAWLSQFERHQSFLKAGLKEFLSYSKAFFKESRSFSNACLRNSYHFLHVSLRKSYPVQRLA